MTSEPNMYIFHVIYFDMLMLFFFAVQGSVTRLFTSATQNQHDPLILSGFWSSIGLNALILGLIFYYKRYQSLLKAVAA